MTSPSTDPKGPAQRAVKPLNRPWHAYSPGDAQSALASRATGLDDDEAARRLLSHGPNRIARTPPVSAWTLLRAQFSSVVILLLIAASGFSIALGDYADALAIAIVVVLNAGIGFVIEIRAVRAMDSLLDLQGARALVVRDGHLRAIDAAGLVPGDVIELRAGQTVAADGRLLERAGSPNGRSRAHR